MRRILLVIIALCWLPGCVTLYQALYDTSKAVAPPHPVNGTLVFNAVLEPMEDRPGAARLGTQPGAAVDAEGSCSQQPWTRASGIVEWRYSRDEKPPNRYANPLG
jgi:hypothetical protein